MRCCVVAWLGSVGLTQFAHAQHIPVPIVNAARAAALATPLVASGQAQEASARALLDGAKYAWYPQFGVSSTAGTPGARGVSFNAEQPLYDFGRRSHEKAALEKRLNASKKSTAEFEHDAALRGARVTVALARATALLGVAQSNVTLHEQFLANIRRRQEGGVNTVADVSIAQTRLVQAQAQVIDQRESLNLLRRQYQIITQLNAPQDAALDWPEPPPLPYSGDVLLTKAVEASPRIASQRLESQALRDDAKAMGSALYPQLAAKASRLMAAGSNRNDWSAGFGLNWQGDVALSARDKVRAADEKARAAELAIASTQQSLEDSAATAEAAFSAAFARKTSAKDQLEAARRTTEQFQSQFSLGRRTWTEVMNTLNDIYSANARTAEAHYQAWDGWVQMKSLAGELLSTP